MYKYLFGPVPSRRLGMSLGVDLVPSKVCSLDCVYCEVGKTTKLTTDRKEYVLFEKVKEELSHYFEHNPDPDYITFSGAGEPTLNSKIGKVMDLLKSLKPDLPVAVLTNGTLLSDPEVKTALLKADLVLPSLDAATESVFQKINRPEPGLTIESYVQGIIDFKKEYTGKIWLEILILPGYNDHTTELDALKEAILKIQPEQVQVNTLDRPGTLADLRGATRAELEKILRHWDLEFAQIISAAPNRKNIKSYREDTESAILETIARRPCTLDDLRKILGLHVNEINKYLDVLDEEGMVDAVHQQRGVFYQLTSR